jgi:hypothetical protein
MACCVAAQKPIVIASGCGLVETVVSGEKVPGAESGLDVRERPQGSAPRCTAHVGSLAAFRGGTEEHRTRNGEFRRVIGERLARKVAKTTSSLLRRQPAFPDLPVPGRLAASLLFVHFRDFSWPFCSMVLHHSIPCSIVCGSCARCRTMPNTRPSCVVQPGVGASAVRKIARRSAAHL